VGENSKKVWGVYNELIDKFKNEFDILLNVSKTQMVNLGVDMKLVDLIIKNRNGQIKVKPGYDGVYGKAIFDEDTLKREKEAQKKLF
jgi:PHP family Zn ribbon phosphoesterase